MTDVPESRSARLWPFAIVASLVLQASAMLVAVRVASSDPSVAVEPDYYQKAVDWDLTAQRRDATTALGWVAQATVGAVLPGNSQRELRITLSDRDKQAVRGASVSIELFHQARSGDRLVSALEERTAGEYTALLPINKPGLWELRVSARRARDMATLALSLEIGEESR